MNKDILEGKWEQLKGTIKEKWGEITDDELAQIDGDYTRLVGWIKEKRGISEEEAKIEAQNLVEDPTLNPNTNIDSFPDIDVNEHIKNTMK